MKFKPIKPGVKPTGPGSLRAKMSSSAWESQTAAGRRGVQKSQTLLQDLAKSEAGAVVRAARRGRVYNEWDEVGHDIGPGRGEHARPFADAHAKRTPPGRGSYKIRTDQPGDKFKRRVRVRSSTGAIITGSLLAGTGGAVAATQPLQHPEKVKKAEASRRKALIYNGDVLPTTPRGRANYKIMLKHGVRNQAAGTGGGAAAGALVGGALGGRRGAKLGGILGGVAGIETGTYRGNMAGQRDPRYKPLPAKRKAKTYRTSGVQKAAFGELLGGAREGFAGFRHGIRGGSFGQVKGNTTAQLGAKVGHQTRTAGMQAGSFARANKMPIGVGAGVGAVGAGGIAIAHNDQPKPRYGPGWG